MKQGIKTISVDDAECLTVWFNKLVAEKSGIVEDFTVAVEQEIRYIESLSNDINDGRLLSLISYSKGKIVAKIDIKRLPRSVDKHVGEVSFGVLKGNESEGVELIKHSQNVAKNMGIEALIYYILQINTYFARIFEVSGFTKIGTIPNFYKIGETYVNRTIYFKSLVSAKKAEIFLKM